MHSLLPKAALCALAAHLAAAQAYGSWGYAGDLYARDAAAEPSYDDSFDDALYARDAEADPEPYDADYELLALLHARYAEPEPEADLYGDDDEILSLLRARDPTGRGKKRPGLSEHQAQQRQEERNKVKYGGKRTMSNVGHQKPAQSIEWTPTPHPVTPDPRLQKRGGTHPKLYAREPLTQDEAKKKSEKAAHDNYEYKEKLAKFNEENKPHQPKQRDRREGIGMSMEQAERNGKKAAHDNYEYKEKLAEFNEKNQPKHSTSGKKRGVGGKRG